MDLQSVRNISTIKTVANAATRVAGRSLLKVRKHSPIILTATGIAGSVTATVLACKATLKLEDEIDKIERRVSIVKNTPAVDSKVVKMELSYVYTRAVIDIGKLYAPAVSVGVVSIGCLIGAQGIMQRRNAALVAAYAALEKGFNEYRKRVEDALGEDKERELRYGLAQEEVHDTKKGVVEQQLKVVDPTAVSVYARFFDESCPEWTKTPEYNLLFLKSQQAWANNLLHSRGHVFLNEVYDMLGIPRSQAGAIVGWVLNKNGDNFIDFNIYRGDRDVVREFVNGQERSILLDFNVDGPIYNLI